ncbi:MAG TPA: hypothetical protein VFA35_04340, partial [Burkholderiaceae bacterium]|nr:hypothetical protein [Burkholderiaceae bacterium]
MGGRRQRWESAAASTRSTSGRPAADGMGVISAALLVVLSSPQGTDAAPPQSSQQAPARAARAAAPDPPPQRLGVEFDPRTGWPRTAVPAPRAAPEAP